MIKIHHYYVSMLVRKKNQKVKYNTNIWFLSLVGFEPTRA